MSSISVSELTHEDVQNKLNQVLNKLLLFNFKCSDDTVLDKLYDCITLEFSNQGSELEYYDTLFKLFLPWFGLVLDKWNTIVQPVKVFALRIGGFLIRYEEGFNLLVNSEVIPKIISLIKVNNELKNVSISMGYIEMLNGFIHHEAGLRWTIKEDSWKEILLLSHSSTSIYVLKKSWTLLSTMIVKIEKISPDVAQSVLDESLSFLKCENMISMGEMKNPSQLKTRNSSNSQNENIFKLATEILDALISNKLPLQRINELIKNCKLHDYSWTVMHNSNDIKTISNASRLMCFLHALDLTEIEDHKVPQVVGQNFISNIVIHFNLLVTRLAFPVISDIAMDYQFLWEKYGGIVLPGENDKIEKVGDHESEVYKTEDSMFRVQNFLFLVLAMPLFVVVKIKSKDVDCDKLLEIYVEKLYRVACPKTIRFLYSYRDQLSDVHIDIDKFFLKTTQRFIKLASICNKELGVLIFQAFAHLLKQIMTNQSSSLQSYFKDVPQENILNNVIFPVVTTLNAVLSKFKFSWRDSLETVCIMSLAQYVLNECKSTNKLCTETLKLIKLVLLNYLPPNLALLVDTLKGSSMQDLGQQLFKTLHSFYWEVRDSTLEVLTAISSLAEEKFPAFQSLLIEQGFPELIVSIIDCDSEPYVRASAITCISEMVKIKNIWEKHLENKGLMEKIFVIIHFESEGVIRKQAALLAREIYKLKYVPPNLMEQTYDTFYYAAHKDLHWEVKISALEFWDVVIDFYLSEEGMVDGSFPQTIFSKEKKKIIQLTSSKKCHLVLKALRKLGIIGCLSVLWSTSLSECDLEVSRRSVKLMQKLKEVVDEYNVITELSKYKFTQDELDDYHLEKPDTDFLNLTDMEPMTVSEDVACEGTTEMRSVDEIINEIIEEEDIQLLPSLYQSQCAEKVLPKIKRFIIPAEEFVERALSIDVEKLVAERHSWDKKTSEGIESLLDDILQFTKEDEFDTNAVDCY